MQRYKNYSTHPWAMHWWGFLFHVALIIGIVTATTGFTIASFTPMSWFLISIACILAMIWNVLIRKSIRNENK